MGRKSTMPEDAEKKLIPLILQGLTNREIGLKFGRNLSTISSWRRRLFITSIKSAELAAHYHEFPLDKLL